MSAGGIGDDREKHYRTINDELKEKNARLMQEATELKNQKFSIATPGFPDSRDDNLPDGTLNLTQPEVISNNDDIDAVLEPISRLSVTAKTRYLAAKVRALEEDNEKLHCHLQKNTEELNGALNSLQETDQERIRIQRQLTQNTCQLDRLKSGVEEANRRATNLATEKTSLERDIETGRREKEKERQGARAADARLQRALEEAEKLRQQLESARVESDTFKRQVHQLTGENKRIERQKQELIAGFKKQLKLIDVLRRQKMLTEASCALKITEEEFLKTLDWQLG